MKKLKQRFGILVFVNLWECTTITKVHVLCNFEPLASAVWREHQFLRFRCCALLVDLLRRYSLRFGEETGFIVSTFMVDVYLAILMAEEISFFFIFFY